MKIRSRVRRIAPPFSAVTRQQSGHGSRIHGSAVPRRMLSRSAYARCPNPAVENSGGAASFAERFRTGGTGQPSSRIWTIVLAGGEGERLRPLTERWLGRHRPKQYCSFVGTRSMLKHTVDRAEQLSGTDRMLIVAAEHHATHLANCLGAPHLDRVVFQPRNRDTAPGIFLPLAHIITKDPSATVVILPSDHFVYPEEAFLSCVRRAALVAASSSDKVVLLGVSPDNEETEYGWIEPGEPVGWLGGCCIRKVAGFREKPDEVSARQLLEIGGLWSTMVIAARCQALWDLGWRCFPTMMPRFEQFAPYIGTSQENRVLASIYAALPSFNFSDQLLQNVPHSLLVMELHNVVWSDWGSERRIVETLNRLGKSPSFPSEDAFLANSFIEHDPALYD